MENVKSNRGGVNVDLSPSENQKQELQINKPIRLIELFAGIGSQAMALRDLGVKFEHYRVVEFDKYAIKSYNAIHGTNFPTTDITNIHGDDLGIVDTDSYYYLLTYSFPCQDLSLAGKQAGMTKGSGTRSGLLWEVERLLNETENLPQILLMENVPQVHNKKNMADFHKWIEFLENKGYSNFWQDLNAKNYGVAQNRNRCFMVSILGDYIFGFPNPIELNKTMKDYLEDVVEEKYYIKNEKAQKLIQQLIGNGTLENKILTDRVVVDGTIKNPRERKIANCIKARYDSGISNQSSDGTFVIEQ
ncbi:MAG: DNA cytosine methyltransferase [Eisenbergiella sp.]